MLATTKERQDDTTTTSWHVGYSTNDSDKDVLKALDNAKYERYYPRVREFRPVPKRKLTLKQRSSPITVKEEVFVPFFPRYFFIRLNLLDGRWHDMFELMGIRGLICDDAGYRRRCPAPLHDAVIAGLMAQEINGALPCTITPKQIGYEIGELVRISNGTFIGFNGLVERLPDIPLSGLDETARLRVLVDLFGGACPVELALSDIEKL